MKKTLTGDCSPDIAHRTSLAGYRSPDIAHRKSFIFTLFLSFTLTCKIYFYSGERYPVSVIR
jgi:hypothetical protein